MRKGQPVGVSHVEPGIGILRESMTEDHWRFVSKSWSARTICGDPEEGLDVSSVSLELDRLPAEVSRIEEHLSESWEGLAVFKADSCVDVGAIHLGGCECSHEGGRQELVH